MLKGFPATDADAANFLDQNHAYFAAPVSAKKKKDASESAVTAEADGRPGFLSVLDAVLQLTTK